MPSRSSALNAILEFTSLVYAYVATMPGIISTRTSTPSRRLVRIRSAATRTGRKATGGRTAASVTTAPPQTRPHRYPASSA